MVDPDPNGFDKLPRGYRNRWPFRICAPSFIYPAPWAVNARLLAPFVDEIELLLFESDPSEGLPSPQEITDLATIAARSGLRYNVHLPIDVDPGAAAGREQAVAAIKAAIALTRPLAPTVYTLHLPSSHPAVDLKPGSRWRNAVRRSLTEILQTGINPQQLTIENLDYPLEMIAGLIAEFDLGICLDTGHLWMGGGEAAEALTAFKDRVRIVHLHGTAAGKDHLALDALAPERLHRFCRLLHRFDGIVSVEVFNRPALVRSLALLEKVLTMQTPRP